MDRTLLEDFKRDLLRILEMIGILCAKQDTPTVPPVEAPKQPVKPLKLPPDSPKPPTPSLITGVDLHGHSFAWRGGTLTERKAMYALAEKICKEEKLTPVMTKDLLLTVYGESGFNAWCINTQSFDYGVAQFSKRYYLVEYKMSPQEAIDNPERCLRIMARNFKAGRQSNWVAYNGRNQHANGLKTLV